MFTDILVARLIILLLVKCKSILRAAMDRWLQPTQMCVHVWTSTLLCNVLHHSFRNWTHRSRMQMWKRRFTFLCLQQLTAQESATWQHARRQLECRYTDRPFPEPNVQSRNLISETMHRQCPVITLWGIVVVVAIVICKMYSTTNYSPIEVFKGAVQRY